VADAVPFVFTPGGRQVLGGAASGSPDVYTSTAGRDATRFNAAYGTLQALGDKILSPSVWLVFHTEESWLPNWNSDSDFGLANEYAARKQIQAWLDRDKAQFDAAETDPTIKAAADQMEADLHAAQSQFGIDGSNVDPAGTPDPSKMPPPITPQSPTPQPVIAPPRKGGGLGFLLLAIALLGALTTGGGRRGARR